MVWSDFVDFLTLSEHTGDFEVSLAGLLDAVLCIIKHSMMKILFNNKIQSTFTKLNFCLFTGLSHQEWIRTDGASSFLKGVVRLSLSAISFVIKYCNIVLVLFPWELVVESHFLFSLLMLSRVLVFTLLLSGLSFFLSGVLSVNLSQDKVALGNRKIGNKIAWLFG